MIKDYYICAVYVICYLLQATLCCVINVFRYYSVTYFHLHGQSKRAIGRYTIIVF